MKSCILYTDSAMGILYFTENMTYVIVGELEEKNILVLFESVPSIFIREKSTSSVNILFSM